MADPRPTQHPRRHLGSAHRYPAPAGRGAGGPLRVVPRGPDDQPGRGGTGSSGPRSGAGHPFRADNGRNADLQLGLLGGLHARTVRLFLGHTRRRRGRLSRCRLADQPARKHAPAGRGHGRGGLRRLLRHPHGGRFGHQAALDRVAEPARLDRGVPAARGPAPARAASRGPGDVHRRCLRGVPVRAEGPRPRTSRCSAARQAWPPG